jgi:putative MATE family efflux protein
MKGKGTDFTQGSVLANIVRMAIPMTLAFLVNVTYSVVDRIYIGHMPDVGSLALTGIGLAFPITTVITAFQNLFGSGGSPLFSMALGRGDKENAKSNLANSAFMLIFMGVVLTVCGFVFKEKVLWLIGASEKTFTFANDYLDIYLLGTVFVMISLGLNPYINAQGYATTGMLTVLIGAIINIVLDPVFIFVLNMGVKGAAWATIISQAVSALWVLTFLCGKKVEVKLSFKGFLPDFKMIGKIMSLGMTEFCFALTNSAVSMLYNAKLQVLGGDSWVGAMTVVNSLREVFMTIMHGVTGATRPIISYNYGARCFKRVRESIRDLFIIIFCYYFLVWALLMLFPDFFASLFLKEASMLEPTRIGIRLFFCLQFFMAFQSTGQSTFTALGMARHALFFSLLRKALLVIPLTLLLPNLFGLGVYGVFLSEPVSDLLGGLSCFTTMYFTVYRKLPKTDRP